MIGWLYFIASCYIVTFIAKSITKGINYLLKLIIREIKKFRLPVRNDSKEVVPKQEVDNSVHECCQQ